MILMEAIQKIFSEEQIITATLIADVAYCIAEKRNELNLTQDELAKQLGISVRTLSRWENAQCDFKLSQIAKLVANGMLEEIHW